jgi:Zn-dependent peptidase ImmA (M78 family)/DNA-binding XRE family transcriptional regulator
VKEISGSRIRQARELAGLTQKELASRVGITQPAIAKYEKEFAQPSEENLFSIAMQTGFPIAFFRLPSARGVPLGSHLLFRARSTTPVHEQVRAHRLAEVIDEAIENLAVDINMVKPKLPKLNAGDPAAAARLTRSQMSLPPDKPVDNLVLSIERAGIRAIALPLEMQRVDAFSWWNGDEADRPIIAIMSGRPGDHLRFSVAHELGHLVLHGALKGSVRMAEKEANLFAAEFLMPETAMRDEIIPPVTLMDIAKLKPRWKVSMQALVRRAYDLKIITERQYEYLFVQISARGWRKQEPSNLEVQIEKPRLLKKMIELIFQTPIPYSKVAARLCWTEQFTRRVIDNHADRNGAFQSTISTKGTILDFKPSGS